MQISNALEMFRQLGRAIFKRPAFTAARKFSERPGCGKDERPRCSSENLSKKPCDRRANKKGESREKPTQSKSMWFNPECCLDPCPDVLPRFDDLYYKISDKAKRIYQQTWMECPERRIVKKVICNYDKYDYPPMEKRQRKSTKLGTACSMSGADCDLMNCSKGGSNARCVKITMPGCRAARSSGQSCKKARLKMDCKKICCPYPSFSECTKPKPKPMRPTECNCLAPKSMCEIYQLIKKYPGLYKL